jgi:DNA-binding NtrC family response regulator
VKAGRFREDLFFKLSVFRVRVPPLRERSDDVPMLVRLFESKHRGKEPISSDTIDMLVRHDWPGNVRELRNVVERLCAFPDLGAGAIARALGKNPDDDESSGAKLKQEMVKTLLSLPYHEAKDRARTGWWRASRRRTSPSTCARRTAWSPAPRSGSACRASRCTACCGGSASRPATNSLVGAM